MPDEVWEVRNLGVGWSGEAVAEIVSEGDAQLVAGLGERQEGIAAVATGVAAIGSGVTSKSPHVHGVGVDSKGDIYAALTQDRSVDKFVLVS